MRHLMKLTAVLTAAVIALSFAGCSEREVPPKAEASKPGSGSVPVSSEPEAADGSDFSGETVLSALAPFTIAGYDYEPGDFSHQFTLTDAQQAEFNKLLRASEWEEITELHEHGHTTFLQAINPDGYHIGIGEWHEDNSFVAISDNSNHSNSTWYLAPRAVVEDAKALIEQLNAQEDTPKPEEKSVGTEFELDTVKFKLALPEGWTAKGSEIYADDVKIAELLPCIPNSDGKAFESLDAQYTDAEAAKDCTVGSYSGKYYHIQTEISGTTAFENKLFYYLDIGDQLLQFGFYPMFGIGIGTQREEFEAVLSTIRVHP